jgi:hypothetical protein
VKIGPQSTALEIAVLVSQALEEAGIVATLSGGGAVSIYTTNLYESNDLDFVTTERTERLASALAPLGFSAVVGRRHFAHPDTAFLLEFPAGPLMFGVRVVQHDEIPKLQTPSGLLRVVTPTLCVMDRLAAYWHWSDRQAWDQAVMVARSRNVDYEELASFAVGEGANPADIARLQREAGA